MAPSTVRSGQKPPPALNSEVGCRVGGGLPGFAGYYDQLLLANAIPWRNISAMPLSAMALPAEVGFGWDGKFHQPETIDEPIPEFGQVLRTWNMK